MINSYRSFKDGTLSDWQMGDGLDKCTQCGYYIVRISHRDVAAQGLPFVPADEGHYLVGHLFVSETGCDDKLQRDRGVAQMLLLNDCNNLRADVYCRSGACANGECFWDEWTRLVGNADLNELENKLQRSVDVGQVSSLDGLTESGIYNGTYSGGVNPFETFVLFVIDNFAAAGATSNLRSVSQFKYALNVDGTFSHKTRTGQGAKSIAWGNWVDLGAASTTDIQDNSITAQKLSIDVREKVEKVPALEESVAREKSALVNGDTIVGLTREVYSRQGKVDAATFLKRTTAGGTSISDGVASIRQIGGNIVKNLLGGFKSVSTCLKYNVEFENDSVIINAKENYIGDTAGSSHIGISTLNFISGHTYYVSANCYSEVDREVYICSAVNGYARTTKFADISANEWLYASKIVTVTGDDLTPHISIYPFGVSGDILIREGAFVLYGGINIIDLTEMYGAGKEPSLADCDKMFATMAAMSRGLTAAQPTGLKSTGFNQWNCVNLFTGKTVADNAIVDGDKSIAFFECLPCRVGAGENNGYVIGYGEGDEWSDEGIEVYLSPLNPLEVGEDSELYLCKLEKDATCGTYVPLINGFLLVVTPKTDKFCAHLLWSEDRARTDYEEYVESVVTLPTIPQMSEWGLAGIAASGVRDTIDLETNKFTKRVGCVDLGSLTWVKMEATRFRTTGVNLNRVVNTVQLVCDKFTVLPTIHAKETYINAGVKDVIFPVSFDNDINIITSAEYESASSFKAAISGVMLYYELPTPEEFPITAKPAPNYVGCDYGVEQWTGSKVPLVANILFYMRSLVSETRNFLDRLYANTATTDANEVADYIINNLGGSADISLVTTENDGLMSAEDKKVLDSLFHTNVTLKTDFVLVETPARIDNIVKASTGFAGYRYDLQGLYSQGFRYIRFKGSNYTLDSDIVRGLIVNKSGTVENSIITVAEKSNGWEELPITGESLYLKASYTRTEPSLYGELFEPKYVELVKNDGEVVRLRDSVSDIERIIDKTELYSFNLINPDDLLLGYSLSEGQLVTNANGIFSNKLTLEIGKTYTIKDVPTFQYGGLVNVAVAIFVAKYNSSDVYLGRDSIQPNTSPTLGDGYVTVTYTPTDETVAYYRVLLQSGSNQDHLFDVSRAMIYEGTIEVNEFTPYMPIFVTAYDKTQDARITNLEELANNGGVDKKVDGGILLTGASFAYSANSWFAKVCASLNKKAYNKAVSGESIRDTAVKMYNGTLYSKAEFEDFDTLLIMHVHNQDVCDEVELKDNYADYSVSASMSYSQAYDYVLKKYAAECYAAKDDSTSKWYGTQYGKPCRVVCMTHWHDARTVFNESIRRLRDKWGFELVELDKNIGFSKNQLHSVTGGQVSVIHAQDTEVIDGVTYGWHPSRATGAYIQDRIAEIANAAL